jgi:VanW like protein
MMFLSLNIVLGAFLLLAVKQPAKHRSLIPMEPGQALPTRSRWQRIRGFTKGREVREGCVIPTTGGGLRQLSGSLSEVALSVDCELVERHRHTALPADVAYDPCRDATLFWNYVDLRFRTPVRSSSRDRIESTSATR